MAGAGVVRHVSLKHFVILGALAKVLLFPAYYSTDFDVHRNWLAITSNLPLKDWYHEATSQWTLDYPPFFAYFEYGLSHLVPQSAIKDGALDIVAEDGLYGWPTIMFQRLTVLASELLLAYSLQGLDTLTTALIWFNPGWLVLDHMHFQYNGAMFGLFILSLRAVRDARFLKGAFLFATLLCFKHIYLYVAPAYFVYLLTQYIGQRSDRPSHSLRLGEAMGRSIKLGIATLTPFMAAFMPLLSADPHGLPAVLERLFPFSRGLTHAYWAPNFWALYSATDRVLGLVHHNAVESATRGIVGQIEFSNLADVSPRMTFFVTLGFQLLSAVRANSSNFGEVTTLCAFASFLFGWHVHEKAVLLVLVPFTLVATKSRAHERAFAPLLVSSTFSLFPLIWTPAETLLKVAYAVGYLVTAACYLPNGFSGFVGKLNAVYTAGFALVMPLAAVLPFFAPRFEFAGLMLVSVYSATGVLWSWLQLTWIYLTKSRELSDPITQMKQEKYTK